MGAGERSTFRGYLGQLGMLDEGTIPTRLQRKLQADHALQTAAEIVEKDKLRRKPD